MSGMGGPEGRADGPAADEIALVEAIRRDEPGAFERFVAAFGDRLYGFGVRMCGEREDARDVVQETFIQAFRSLKDLEHPEALRSWLYRVAANACLMKRRRGKFEPERELSLEELGPDPDGGHAAEIPDPSASPEAELARLEVRDKIRSAIGDLPPHYRIVLVMRDMEQLSTEETARALGLAATAVKMRLHRARLMVRQRLEREIASGRSR